MFKDDIFLSYYILCFWAFVRNLYPSFYSFWWFTY